MPTIQVNDLDHYYEQTGEGPALIFVHGAFVDSHLWAPQVQRFAAHNQVLRYDLRGHGRTGPSDLSSYSIGTFARDLTGLLDALDIQSPVLCGLSLGGMIAQAFAVQHPARLRALILADTAVSVSLTLSDKLQRYVLFPKWAMELSIRAMSAEQFTRLSFWLARLTRSGQWFGQDPDTRDYVQQCMLRMDDSEYLKLYGAMYDFHLLPLERITCPTLVLNGEYESKSVFRHAAEILKRVPEATAQVVPGAGHTSNMENAEAFNDLLAAFLTGLERH